jgi:DNA-binding beta-propeller fold protein YncE
LLVWDRILNVFLGKKINLFPKFFVVILGVLNTGGSTTSLLYGPGYVIHDRTTKQLYVADIGNSRIMAYCDNNAGGTIIAGTSIPGSLATQLSDPYEFGFDTNWNLYVLDSDNNRVQKFTRL